MKARSESPDAYSRSPSLSSEAVPALVDISKLSIAEVQAELKRILSSEMFVRSGRLQQFLTFAVNQALADDSALVKEYVIGTQVYGRDFSFDPSQDSIVRTEARRLRAKLGEYYETEAGRRSVVLITFRPGSYVPSIVKRLRDTPLNRSGPDTNLLMEGTAVSIAVLPFLDLSHTTASGQCALGLQQELTHALTNTGYLQVVSPALVQQVLSEPHEKATIASKLDVVCTMEGSVREQEGRLNATISISNVDGFQWTSHQFDTVADESFLAHIQSRIISSFVSRVRPEQSKIRKRQAGAGALTLTVYPIVIQAEGLLDNATAEDLQAGLRMFREAVEIAPSFARGHRGLAQCHLAIAIRGAERSHGLAEEAKLAAQRAVDLDPEMLGCLGVLGSAQTLLWNFDAAASSFESAVELGTDAATSRQYALFLAALGRFDESAQQIDLAQHVDPFSMTQKVAITKLLHLSGDFESGVALFDRPSIYGPMPLVSTLHIALMAAHLGDKAKVSQIVDSLRSTTKARNTLFFALAEILAWVGDKDGAVKLLRNVDLNTAVGIPAYRRSLLSLAFDEEAQALAHLQEAINNQEVEAIWLKTDSRWKGLSKNATFLTLRERLFPPTAFRE